MPDHEYELRLLQAAIKLRNDRDRLIALLQRSKGLWGMQGDLVTFDQQWAEARDKLLLELGELDLPSKFSGPKASCK